MIKYPSAIDTTIELPYVIDNQTPIDGALINNLRDAVIAVESELGIKPSGIYSNVRSRIAALETTISNLLITGGITFGGDLTPLTDITQKVVGLQNRPLSASAPSDGYLITWNALASEWQPLAPTVGFTANGDLSGNSTTQAVEKIHGATVPVAGSLTTGNILYVSGTSSLTYGPLNLGGGSNYITGSLPSGNQAAQTMGGDCTGTTANSTVAKINATIISTSGGSLTTGKVLRVTGISTADWGAIDLANSAAVTGVLPKDNQGSQDLAGDLTGTTAASVVSKVNGITYPSVSLTTGQVPRATGTSTVAYGALDLANSSAITGTLPLGSGGTGQTSFGSGIIHSNGSALSSSAVSLTADVTGTLPVGNGGTGQSSFSAGILSSNGTTISSVAPSTSGNVLTSDGSAWVSSTPSLWQTLLDLDFTAQSNQTLGSDTTFTIGGKTWTKSNSANELVAMTITNGTGLVIQPGKSGGTSYGANTRTAPLLYLPFSQLSLPSDFSVMAGLRVMLYLSNYSRTLDGNGNCLYFGVDTGSTTFGLWAGLNFFLDGTHIVSQLGRTLNATGSNTSIGGGDQIDWSTYKVACLETPCIAGGGDGWPLLLRKGTTGMPSPKTGLTSVQSHKFTLTDTDAKYMPADISTGFGLVIAGSSPDLSTSKPVFTVARVRVDVRS